MATSVYYRIYTGPAFFAEISRNRPWEIEERAQVFIEAANVTEFAYGRDWTNREDLMARLMDYLRARGLAKQSPILVDGEQRMVQVFQEDLEVDRIVADLLSNWGDEEARRRAGKFYRRFLETFPRRFDPGTIHLMKPFIFRKTAWV